MGSKPAHRRGLVAAALEWRCGTDTKAWFPEPDLPDLGVVLREDYTAQSGGSLPRGACYLGAKRGERSSTALGYCGHEQTHALCRRYSGSNRWRLGSRGGSRHWNRSVIADGPCRSFGIFSEVRAVETTHDIGGSTASQRGGPWSYLLRNVCLVDFRKVHDRAIPGSASVSLRGLRTTVRRAGHRGSGQRKPFRPRSESTIGSQRTFHQQSSSLGAELDRGGKFVPRNHSITIGFVGEQYEDPPQTVDFLTQQVETL